MYIELPIVFSASLLNINGQLKITGHLGHVSYLKDQNKNTKVRNLEKKEARMEEENFNKI